MQLEIRERAVGDVVILEMFGKITIGEGSVPLVPHAAGRVVELSPAGQHERHSGESTLDADVQRRLRFDQIGNLAQRLQTAITSPEASLPAMNAIGLDAPCFW